MVLGPKKSKIRSAQEPPQMQAMFDNLLARRKEWREIEPRPVSRLRLSREEAGCEDEGELQDASVVEKQLMALGGLLDDLEESFQTCLDLGRSLLLALGERCPELRLGEPQAGLGGRRGALQAGLAARKVDQNLESLRWGSCHVLTWRIMGPNAVVLYGFVLFWWSHNTKT